jgi:hypothetical protein
MTPKPYASSLPDRIVVGDDLIMTRTTHEDAKFIAPLILGSLDMLSPWFPWASGDYSVEGFRAWLDSLPSWEDGNWEYNIVLNSQIVGHLTVWVNVSGDIESGSSAPPGGSLRAHDPDPLGHRQRPLSCGRRAKRIRRSRPLRQPRIEPRQDAHHHGEAAPARSVKPLTGGAIASDFPDTQPPR